MKNLLIESLHNYTDALEQKFVALEQRIAQLEEENCIRKTENETLREENEALKAEIAALATASVAFVGAGSVALDENNEPEVEVELIVSEEEDEVTAEPIVTEQQETIEESTPEEVEPKEDILPIVSQETIEQEMAEEPIVEPIVEAEPIVEPEPVVTSEPVVAKQEEAKEVAQEVEQPIVKESKPHSYPTQTTLFGSSVDDIRQAISLGDRFLFQRELFGGNGELMQKTLDILNQKHDFDDALAYINKNFDWNQDSSTYELFINVLHRRF
jgi:hypothetical protein